MEPSDRETISCVDDEPNVLGVAFLRTVREVAPDVVRILLTGQPDLESSGPLRPGVLS